MKIKGKKGYIQLATLLGVLGIGIIIIAWQVNSSSQSDNNQLPNEIEELIPQPNSSRFLKDPVGIEFKGTQRYNIMLWLNGNLIPEDVVARTATRLTYRPDDDETMIGTNCIRVQYSLVSRPVDISEHEWCYDVST